MTRYSAFARPKPPPERRRVQVERALSGFTFRTEPVRPKMDDEKHTRFREIAAARERQEEKTL